NGGALRLTVAKYYTPSGRLIQKSYRSINKDFEADSVDYQTRLLNRKVLSGNGIVPDYIIDETEDLKCRNYLSYLDFFILNKMLETASLEVATDEITRQEYARFLENNFELETSYFEDSCPVSKFQRILESRCVRLISGEKEYIKKLNEGDPFIQKALLFIQDQKTTLAYLSEKN
ncbi:MAG: hypothetical protein KJO29_04805, partial [Bacteroidia bacterium]|nr:hypothetical protein [Bacteroidia bacterium]